jgi:hypothetical protein
MVVPFFGLAFTVSSMAEQNYPRHITIVSGRGWGDSNQGA